MLIKTYDETARPGERLLYVDVDKELLSTIEKLLGNMKKESRQVLKNAVNATAKQARAALIARTKKEYAVKKGPLTKATRIEKRATASTPKAAITVKGPALELREFKTTAPKSGAKAKILTGSTLKTIQSQKGSRAKAFLATFESGHTAVVQRQDGEEYTRGREKRIDDYGRHIDMTRIKKLLSVSYAKMAGSSAVFGSLGTSLYDTLLENVNREIERLTKA